MIRTIRSLGLAVVLLLAAVAPSLHAQGIGTPEHYVKDGQEALAAGYHSGAVTSFRQATMLRPQNAEYHFLLGTALASDGRWDDAREAFARAQALEPGLTARVDAWLARAPGATPPRPPAVSRTPAPRTPPTPPPTATPPTAPAPGIAPAAGGAFAVGDRVEIEYRVGEWFPGVVTAVDAGACPYYRVRADPYGKGNPSDLGYGCRSVRAPTGIPATKAACGGSNPNCTPTSAPPPGTYLCTELVWQGTGATPQYRPRDHGTITLLAGNRYRMFRDGAVGRYRYDPATFRIQWIGGGMAGRGGAATYGLDGTTPEITIVFETAYTRSTGNQAPRWQCGLGR